jgi:hypothetical protein
LAGLQDGHKSGAPRSKAVVVSRTQVVGAEMSQREKLSNLEQRVKWLLDNRIHLTGKTDVRKIVRAMKRDGLISKSTYWPDCKKGVDLAIHQAKMRWFAEHNGRVPK